MLYVKYYPKTFDDILKNDNIKLFLNKLLKYDKMKNIILKGYEGCGKSSLMKIFLKKKEGFKIIEMVPGIDGINDLEILIKKSKLCGKKIFFLDNCTNLTLNIQKSLNILINNSKSSNFVVCTNNIESMITTLQTSFFILNFDYIDNISLLKYFKNICLKEKINIDETKIKNIIKYSKNDYRKITNNISIHEDINFDYENNLLDMINSKNIKSNIDEIIKLSSQGHTCLDLLFSFKSLIKEGFEKNNISLEKFNEYLKTITKFEIIVYDGNDSIIQLLSFITYITNINIKL